MARPRNPLGKAKTEGRDQKDPQRFKKRAEPSKNGPLGAPPDWMGGEQRLVWSTFQTEIPWLTESHRALVEIAVTIRARLTAGQDVGVQALNLLRQCLGQMGATPSDASKIAVPDGDEEDPDEALFNR